jgi:L-amino acid N-acyltransferase YncA
MHDSIAQLYPREHQLEDGARITCALMQDGDQKALTSFLSRLTRMDLLYLQFDVRKPEVQKQWFADIAHGKSICICARDPAGMVGYASIQMSEAAAPDQYGEIRVNISQAYRSRGLGRILTQEIFEVAKILKLRRLTARMLSDQFGAKSAFERLGFHKQSTLHNHVQLKSGETKDLLIMARQLDD